MKTARTGNGEAGKNSARKYAGKTRGKPFQDGNPGKPRGARHKVTRAIEELLEGEHEALTRKAIEKALEGDNIALRLCLERLAPARKDVPIAFDLPAVRTAPDIVAASAAVLAAVAAGDITPAEGGSVMLLLTSHRAIVETGDHDARLRALEASVEKKTGR